MKNTAVSENLDFARLRVNTGDGVKDIFIVGEFHIYGIKESEWAYQLLKNNFDYCFFEGVELGKFFGPLYNIFFRLAQLTTFKKQKTLIQQAEEKGIPTKWLEEGTTLPMKTKIGLSLLFIIFFIIIFKLIAKPWGVVVTPISIVLLLRLLHQKKFRFILDKLYGYAPSIKEERDKIMSKNLMKYIKELNFNTGLVVVGRVHFPQIVAAIHHHFNVIP